MPSPRKIDAGCFSADAREFLRLLAHHGVEYVVVGGEAVIYHGYPRLTGDIDFFYRCDAENVGRLHACLSEFWGGDIPGISEREELLEEGIVVQFGRPPNRIDLLNRIDGLTFEQAVKSCEYAVVAGGGETIPVRYIGLDALLQNKRASGRPKDLDDVAHLTPPTSARLRPREM